MRHVAKKGIVFQISIMIIAIVMLPFSLFACTKPTKPPLTTSELMQSVQKSVCEVVTDVSFGSGFIFKIDNDKLYIITNYHVVKNEPVVKLKFFDKSIVIDGSVIGFNSYHDIAVIEATTQNSTLFSALVLKQDVALMGQDAFLIGNALGHGLAAFEGIVSKPVQTTTYTDPSTQRTKRVPVVAVTTPINPGCSGSAIFDSVGHVIGVGTYQTTVSGDREIENMAYAVPSSIAYALANQIVHESKAKEASPSLSECAWIDVIMRVSGADSDAIYIDFEGLNFFSVFKNGELTVTGTAFIPVAFGEPLLAGDKIIAIGDLKIKDATLFDIFNIVSRYIDDRAYEGVEVTEKMLTVAYDREGTKKEVGFLNKYEKNN